MTGRLALTSRTGLKSHPARSQPLKEIRESEFYEPYSAFARMQRGWFLAYGVAAPALFVSSEPIAQAIIDSGRVPWIVGLFLGGVLFQVIEMLIYKYAMWNLYMDESYSDCQREKGTPCSSWIAESVWLMVVSDVLTLGLYIAGTVCALTAVA